MAPLFLLNILCITCLFLAGMRTSLGFRAIEMKSLVFLSIHLFSVAAGAQGLFTMGFWRGCSSVTYSTPGTYLYRVPNYNVITVSAVGGGGSGGTESSDGNNGTASSFDGALLAGGGAGGRSGS